MMDIFTFSLAALAIILISLWMSTKNKIRNPLPGPIGLPIMGYLPFMTKKPYKKFQELSKIYGPVYKVRLGMRDVVVLCGHEAIREALNEDAFFGRPNDSPFQLSETSIRTGAFLGLAFKEQRNFALHSLRDLGFGKTRMEEHIKEEILEALEKLEDQKSSVKVSDIFTPSASNNIASLLFGKRMQHNDPRRKKLDKLLNEIGLYAVTTSWQVFFPGIRALMKYFNIGNSLKLSKALKNVKDFIREEIKEHEQSLDPDNIRDFIDQYLLEIRKKEGDTNSSFQKDVLVDLGRSFFSAGTETTRITLDWLLLVAAASPGVQEKIHREIDEVLGRERFPTWQDRLSMPYTEAAIMEVMRWRTTVPLNLMRYTLKDAAVKGYFIPRYCHVLAVLYCPDHDESLWGKDVEEYKPERFLSEDGKKVSKPEYFNPFSIATLQKFRVSLPYGKEANFEPVLGVSLMPQRQSICLDLR